MKSFIKLYDSRDNTPVYVNVNNISTIWEDEKGAQINLCSAAEDQTGFLFVTVSPEKILELVQG